MLKKGVVFIIVLVCSLLLVHGINSIPIILWDESLYSTNAIEMLHNSIWSMHYYDGAIDYYNLKPPFFTWLRALSFSLFGYEYWVHRLPSALFSLITLAVLYKAAHKLLKSEIWACLAIVFLTVAPAYNTLHVTKGGEYDSMLACIMFVVVLLFLKALRSNEFKWRVFTIVALGLAFYTKSLAGLFFVPGMLICILVYKRDWLSERRNWILAFSFLLFPLVYYGVLYVMNPEYVLAIYKHHFTRYGNTLNDVVLPFWHYFKSPSVLPFVALPLVCTLYLKWRKVNVQSWAIQSQILVFALLLLLSASATKHGFYTAAIFPVASLSLTYLLYAVLGTIQYRYLKMGSVALLVLVCMLGLHFTYAKSENYMRYYNRAFPKAYLSRLLQGDVLMQPLISEVNYGEDPRIYYNETRHWFDKDDVSKVHVFAKDLHIPNSEGYNPLLMFYVDYWRLEKEMTVLLNTTIDELKVGDFVLCAEVDKQKQLEDNFKLKFIQRSEHCQLVRLKEK